MTDGSRPTVGRGVAVLTALAFLLAGSGATYLIMRQPLGDGGPVAPVPPKEAGQSSPRPDVEAGTAALPDVVVPLSREELTRAGIVVAPVSTARRADSVRMPGTVEPNAYRQVAVTPLVAGRVTGVAHELGDRVRRGETMAQVYSPELAEAQMKYVAAGAMLEAHDRELRRTEKLVEIGAASRQELERLQGEHSAQVTEVDAARSRLELLGVPAVALAHDVPGHSVSATIDVPAPIDGVVTERLVNIGLNVDPSMKLFTVVDLSTVWVVADLYERDFSRVRVGSRATVTTAAYPDLVLPGRVSYIDPQVSPDTRTARLRVEVPNRSGDLRLGMYADVIVDAAGEAMQLVIPRSAVQNVGDRTVVYLVNPAEPERFIEREVRLGRRSGDQVEVTAGLVPGDEVVSEGSFFIRAERERLGLRPISSGATAPPVGAGSSVGEPEVQRATVIVSPEGFEPSTLTLHAGIPAAITFRRTTDQTCATEVVFPSLKIRRELPLNRPVVVEFTPGAGTIAFTCAAGMLGGSVVAQ